jgi:hypothetical protein
LAQANYQAQLASLVQPGDAAQESRNTRTWDRERRKLDAAPDAGHLIASARQALESATRPELGVLLQEFPSYLESHDVPTDWINPVVAQTVPEIAAAQQQAQRAQQAATVVHYDTAALRTGIQKGSPPSQLVDPTRFDPDRVD